AEPLYRQALATRRKLLGDAHPNVAVVMVNLAWLLENRSKLDEAEALYRQAMDIDSKASGTEHNPMYESCVNHLGTLLFRRGRFAGAEEVFRQSLEARRKLLGPDHPQVAISLHNVGFAVARQDRWAEAETLFREALTINTAKLGPDHPETAGDRVQLGNS